MICKPFSVCDNYQNSGTICSKYSVARASSTSASKSSFLSSTKTSIQPYEDCCTVFTPKHPKTRPELDKVLVEERKLDFDALVEEALQSVNTVHIVAEY